MTFDELVAEVYTLTKRSDLVDDTISAIKSGTLKMHHSDFYSKDIFETGLDLGALEFRHSFDYITFIPNHRAFSYFKRVEDENDDVGKFIEIIKANELLNEYGNNRSDIAYNAGRVLEIRSSVEFRFALIGVYVNPIIATPLTYSSWVADQYPFAIIYEAARIIFLTIGQKEESAAQRILMLEELSLLKQGSILDVGT